MVEHVVTIVSGCVMTFSELEKSLDELRTENMRTFDRLKWAKKEADILPFVQRLQNHKASLSLMLNVLNGYKKESLFKICTYVNQEHYDRGQKFSDPNPRSNRQALSTDIIQTASSRVTGAKKNEPRSHKFHMRRCNINEYFWRRV